MTTGVKAGSCPLVFVVFTKVAFYVFNLFLSGFVGGCEARAPVGSLALNNLRFGLVLHQ